MNKKQKAMLWRIIVSAVLFAAGFALPEALVWAKAAGLSLPENILWVKTAVFAASYLIIGYDILIKAVRNIFRGRVFDENFLMSLATIGAWCIGEYPEGVAVMLFYQVGELFQSYAVGKSRRSIAELMDIRPDTANVERGGTAVTVSPEEVGIGDIIIVSPGERVPLDGVVLEGSGSLNTSALTGESLPRSVEPGDSIISGCVNLSGLLKIKVTKPFGESTVSKILDLVENASSKKASSESFITRFARWYTPIVVVGAVLLAVIPPLFAGGWSVWINRALIFLVISCPCALVISVPLSFFGGIGGASSCGILIKGSNHLEDLAKADTIVFDKTGTLTKGTFSVTAVHPESLSEKELLRLAAFAETYSGHPISLSLKAAYKGEIDSRQVTKVNEIAGHGIRAEVSGKSVLVGNEKLMELNEIKMGEPDSCRGTVIHVAVDGIYAGHILISDELKPDSKSAISSLKAMGIRKTVMLTGDTKSVGEQVADELGIDELHTELMPQDKVEIVESLLKGQRKNSKLAFVGDGINDAPVLARADIGIAMGALGSDAAIEAADVVLMDDNVAKLSDAIKIAKRTLRIVTQNIVFALGVKLLVLALGACGIATMWEAVFADVGVSVIAILNSMRALHVRKK
ncbi:MAG: heavy metal translocating P-type ATPase [Oscillospiraceae bacterium]